MEYVPSSFLLLMQPCVSTIIKDDLLDLGERLCAYHDWVSWQSTNPNHPQPKEDLVQAVEEYEEYAFLRFDITQDHALWKPFMVKGRFDFFRLRVISLLAFKAASGNSLCPPVLNVVKTCRSLGDEDLDTALRKIITMVEEGLLTIEERMPPYLISSYMALAPAVLETFASKVCLLRPSEIPVPKPKTKRSRRKTTPQGPASPEDIYNKLREYVVDQDEAAKTLACRGYMHLQRAKLIQKGETSGFNQCILMLGSSGVGKTYLAECFGTIAQVPFASVSMTEMTGTGFVGMDICNGASWQALQYDRAFMASSNAARSWSARSSRISASPARVIALPEYVVVMMLKTGIYVIESFADRRGP